MLKWENFVIQQEKMKMLWEDIKSILSLNLLKLETIDCKHREVSALIVWFEKLSHIMELCHEEMQFSMANGQNKEESVSEIINFQDSFEDEEKE